MFNTLPDLCEIQSRFPISQMSGKCHWRIKPVKMLQDFFISKYFSFCTINDERLFTAVATVNVHFQSVINTNCPRMFEDYKEVIIEKVCITHISLWKSGKRDRVKISSEKLQKPWIILVKKPVLGSLKKNRICAFITALITDKCCKVSLSLQKTAILLMKSSFDPWLSGSKFIVFSQLLRIIYVSSRVCG